MSTIPTSVPGPIESSVAPEKRFGFPLLLFITLQCLDLFTTLRVFAHGGSELNPMVRVLMPGFGPVLAVVICKLGIVSAAIGFAPRRKRVLVIANALYAVVVVWNGFVMLVAS